jgi:hypothetical protein
LDRGAGSDQNDALFKIRTITMANSWSITINQLPDGTFTFTPFVPGAHVGQPLGVSSGDLVTWNNQTNGEIKLQSVQPTGLYLTEPIPAGSVSNPIFQFPLPIPTDATKTVTAVGYSRVPPGSPPPAQPDHWIIVVPPPNVA